MSREKLCKELAYKKGAFKILVKLTLGVNFINIEHTAFMFADLNEQKDSQISSAILRFWDLHA